MARKREGDGLKWQVVERNGVKYVYTSTSTMKNGRKASVSEYLGRLDSDGELDPKKKGRTKAEREKAASEKHIELLDGLCSREYGAVHFLDCVQRRIRLGDDLYRCFGLSGTTILAMAEAMAIAQSNVFLDIGPQFSRTSLRQYYGLESSMDSGSISDFTNAVGGASANMDRFYSQRMNRCTGVVSFDTTTNGTYSDIQGLAEWLSKNKDNEFLKQIKTGLATDMRGIPLAMHHYPATLSDLDTVRALLDDVKRYGREDDCIFAMDRGFISDSNVKFMLDMDLSFVAPAVTSSKDIKSLLTRMKDPKKAVSKVFDKHAYEVWETAIGLSLADGKASASGGPVYRFTSDPDNPEYCRDGRLKAFVVFDSKKYSDEMQSHTIMINDLIAKAETIDSPTPVKVFRKMAGKALRYFDVKADGRKVSLTVKNNSRAFLDNRAGMFIMLASEDLDWETMMTAYDSRRLVEQAFDLEKTADRRFRTSDRISLEGREFVRFVALILRCEIAALFREAGLDSKFTVDGALSSLNSITAQTSGGWSRLDNMDKTHRMIFEACGFEVPKEVLRDRQSYDVTAVAGSG